MQSARSRTMKGTPCSLRHAAVASPEGPAPTIIGPFTQMQRREKKSSWSTRRKKFSIFSGVVWCFESGLVWFFFYEEGRDRES